MKSQEIAAANYVESIRLLGQLLVKHGYLAEAPSSIEEAFRVAGDVIDGRAQPAQAPHDEVPAGTSGRLVALDGTSIVRLYEVMATSPEIVAVIRTEAGKLEIESAGQETDASPDKLTAIYQTAQGILIPESQVRIVSVD